MPRHRALAWGGADRIKMSERLAALGCTIVELSDARELAGRPRLSESTAEQRHYAPLWLLGAAGQGYLAKARAERAMYTEALSHYHAETLYNARHALGLRRATPSCLRLCELRALYLQAGLVLHPVAA
jgi:hypothetical protein